MAEEAIVVVVPHPEKFSVTVRVWLTFASVPVTFPVEPDPLGVALPPPVVVVLMVPFQVQPFCGPMLVIVKAEFAELPILVCGVVEVWFLGFPPLFV